jgi:sugar/nucleoside kinase (ribokinase family)
MNTPELREACAARLGAAVAQAANLTAFVGLDGFVDDIVHVVDKRHNAQSFDRLPTIAKFSERLAGAAGKSTNIELVSQLTKLGGNGPIMANALAALGLKVTYLGALGYPAVHPVFASFCQRAEVHSISQPGLTNALEFEDGKLMLSQTAQLNDVTWANIQSRFGRDKFARHFGADNLIAFVNWTMIPFMSDLWQSLQTELCPGLGGPRRMIFFDLADPQKRTREDITQALDLIRRFAAHFDVCLGLNEKEAGELSHVLGLPIRPDSPEGLAALARDMIAKLGIQTLVIHPVTYALAVSGDVVDIVAGPHIQKPLITTGAGDHFNAGFCLGKLLGLENKMCVLTGVTTSGYYVRTAQSPAITDLAGMLRAWPEKHLP